MRRNRTTCRIDHIGSVPPARHEPVCLRPAMTTDSTYFTVSVPRFASKHRRPLADFLTNSAHSKGNSLGIGRQAHGLGARDHLLVIQVEQVLVEALHT
jgi:hypothetical protein